MDLPQTIGFLASTERPLPPVIFPSQQAPFVSSWAKVPFDVTLGRVEDQRTELNRMQKVLEERDVEVAQLKGQLEEQLVGLDKANEVREMALV